MGWRASLRRHLYPYRRRSENGAAGMARRTWVGGVRRAAILAQREGGKTTLRSLSQAVA